MVISSVPTGFTTEEWEESLRLSATLILFTCRQLLKEKKVRTSPAHFLHLVWPVRLNSSWTGTVLEAYRSGYSGMREESVLTMDIPTRDLAIHMGREKKAVTTIRLPKELKKWVHEYCDDHGISFTKLVIHLLTELRRQRGGEVKVEDL